MFFSDNFVSVYGKEEVTEKERGYTGCTFSHCSYFICFCGALENATRKIFTVLLAKPSHEVYTSKISLLKKELHDE